MNFLSPEGLWGVAIFTASDVTLEGAWDDGTSRPTYFYSTYDKALAFAESCVRADTSRKVVIFDMISAKVCTFSVSVADAIPESTDPVIGKTKLRTRGRKLELDPA